MTETERRSRNAARLAECWPPFARKAKAVIADLEGRGHRPRIQDGWRSPAAQLEAYRSGHSDVKWGLHNATGPGGIKESLAVDLLDDDAPLNPRPAYCLRLASSARAHELETGILWRLRLLERRAVNDAVALKHWDYTGKIGFDPTHLQVPILPLLARLGRRPKWK